MTISVDSLGSQKLTHGGLHSNDKCLMFTRVNFVNKNKRFKKNGPSLKYKVKK